MEEATRRSDAWSSPTARSPRSLTAASLSVQKPTSGILSGELSPMISHITSQQQRWERQAESADERQAELLHTQWTLIREQISVFSQALISMRAELQSLQEEVQDQHTMRQALDETRRTVQDASEQIACLNGEMAGCKASLDNEAKARCTLVSRVSQLELDRAELFENTSLLARQQMNELESQSEASRQIAQLQDQITSHAAKVDTEMQDCMRTPPASACQFAALESQVAKFISSSDASDSARQISELHGEVSVIKLALDAEVKDRVNSSSILSQQIADLESHDARQIPTCSTLDTIQQIAELQNQTNRLTVKLEAEVKDRIDIASELAQRSTALEGRFAGLRSVCDGRSKDSSFDSAQQINCQIRSGLESEALRAENASETSQLAGMPSENLGEQMHLRSLPAHVAWPRTLHADTASQIASQSDSEYVLMHARMEDLTIRTAALESLTAHTSETTGVSPRHQEACCSNQVSGLLLRERDGQLVADDWSVHQQQELHHQISRLAVNLEVEVKDRMGTASDLAQHIAALESQVAVLRSQQMVAQQVVAQQVAAEARATLLPGMPAEHKKAIHQVAAQHLAPQQVVAQQAAAEQAAVAAQEVGLRPDQQIAEAQAAAQRVAAEQAVLAALQAGLQPEQLQQADMLAAEKQAMQQVVAQQPALQQVAAQQAAPQQAVFAAQEVGLQPDEQIFAAQPAAHKVVVEQAGLAAEQAGLQSEHQAAAQQESAQQAAEQQSAALLARRAAQQAGLPEEQQLVAQGMAAQQMVVQQVVAGAMATKDLSFESTQQIQRQIRSGLETEALSRAELASVLSQQMVKLSENLGGQMRAICNEAVQKHLGSLQADVASRPDSECVVLRARLEDLTTRTCQVLESIASHSPKAAGLSLSGREACHPNQVSRLMSRERDCQMVTDERQDIWSAVQAERVERGREIQGITEVCGELRRFIEEEADIRAHSLCQVQARVDQESSDRAKFTRELPEHFRSLAEALGAQVKELQDADTERLEILCSESQKDLADLSEVTQQISQDALQAQKSFVNLKDQVTQQLAQMNSRLTDLSLKCASSGSLTDVHPHTNDLHKTWDALLGEVRVRLNELAQAQSIIRGCGNAQASMQQNSLELKSHVAEQLDHLDRRVKDSLNHETDMQNKDLKEMRATIDAHGKQLMRLLEFSDKIRDMQDVKSLSRETDSHTEQLAEMHRNVELQRQAQAQLISKDCFGVEMKALRDWVVFKQKEFSDNMYRHNPRCETSNHKEVTEVTQNIASDCLELRRSLTDVKDAVAGQLNQMDTCVTRKLEQFVEKRVQDMLSALAGETGARTEQLIDMRIMIENHGKALATQNTDMLEQLNAIREAVGVEHHREQGGSLKSQVANCWQRIMIEKDAVETRSQVLRTAFDSDVQSRLKESTQISSDLSNLRDSIMRVEYSVAEFNGNTQRGLESSTDTLALQALEKRCEELCSSLQLEVSCRTEAVNKLGSEIQVLRLSLVRSASPSRPGSGGWVQAVVSSDSASAPAAYTGVIDVDLHLNQLRGELAQEVQLREAALSKVMEAVSLETNARVAKGAELRRELHAMVHEHGGQAQPINKLEESVHDSLKEVKQVWNALNMHTHPVNVDVSGSLGGRLVRTPSLPPGHMCIAGPTSSSSPPRTSSLIPRMEYLPLSGSHRRRIPTGTISPPLQTTIVSHPHRMLPLSTSDPHLGLAISPVDGIASPAVQQVSPPRMLLRGCVGSSQADVTTETVLPSAVQSAVADVDVEGLPPKITATCGAAHYILDPA